MRTGRRRQAIRGFGAVGLGIVVLVGITAGSRSWPGLPGLTSPGGVALATVVRDDLEVAVIVAGDVDGAERTLLSCEAEAIHPDGTPRLPTLIELVDDGTWVKKGDVLCRFDASNYEEMVRRQQIEVDRAVSERRQAELELKAARVALAAYRDGEAVAQAEALRGRIALLRSDLERARDRLRWSDRMQNLGYSSADTLAGDRIALQRLEVDLAAAVIAHRNQVRYIAPKQVRELEVRVEWAEESLEYCDLQLENSRSLLERYRKQLEACTVRAPHDGLAVHAEIFWGDDFQMRVGASIYQGQPLFYLPDLGRPVVDVSLHESIAARVKVGMPAEIRIEALPDRTFRGRVESVDQLPTINWLAGMDVKHVMARVRIENPPREGLFPYMSAQVRIITERLSDALVVPVAALSVEAGQQFCYVAGADGVLERRPVILEPADRDRLRVVTGLVEGERVVLDPSPLRQKPPGLLPGFSRPSSLAGSNATAFRSPGHGASGPPA